MEVLFLGLITCGIYSIYFWQKLRNDVNIMCAADGKHTPGIWKALLLGIPTLGIYTVIWFCNMHDRMRTTAKTMGEPLERTTSNIMGFFIGGYFVWGIFTMVAHYKIISSANDLSFTYNRYNRHYA